MAVKRSDTSWNALPPSLLRFNGHYCLIVTWHLNCLSCLSTRVLNCTSHWIRASSLNVYMKRPWPQMQPTWFETNFDYDKPPSPWALCIRKLHFPGTSLLTTTIIGMPIIPFHKDANHSTICMLRLPLMTSYHLSNLPWGGIKWLGQQIQISNWNNTNINIVMQLLYHNGQVYNHLTKVFQALTTLRACKAHQSITTSLSSYRFLSPPFTYHSWWVTSACAAYW